jgi:hypothetical protein
MTYALGAATIWLVAVAAGIAAVFVLRRALGWKVNALALTIAPIAAATGVLISHWK